MPVAIWPENADVKCQDHRIVWQGPPMLRLRFHQAVSPLGGSRGPFVAECRL